MTLSAKQKREKRVALAKDVLAQLKAETLVPSEWGYFDTEPRDGAPCEACAVGALAVACCGLPTEEELQETPIFDYLMGCLGSIFSVRQLGEIEAAFEVAGTPSTLRTRSGMLEHELNAIRKKFCELDGRDRMRAIMENIVTNNGTFVP